MRQILETGNFLDCPDYREHIKQLFNLKQLDKITVDLTIKKNNDLDDILRGVPHAPTSRAINFIHRSLRKTTSYIHNKVRHIQARDNNMHPLHEYTGPAPNHSDFPDPIMTELCLNSNEYILYMRSFTANNPRTPVIIRSIPSPLPSSNNINSDIRNAIHELDDILARANSTNDNNNLLNDFNDEPTYPLQSQNSITSDVPTEIDRQSQTIISPDNQSRQIEQTTVHVSQPVNPPTQDPLIENSQSQRQPLPDSPLDAIPIEQFFLCPIKTATVLDVSLGDAWSSVFTMITDQIFDALTDTTIDRDIKLERAFKLYGGIPQIFFRTEDSDHPNTSLIRKRLMQFITGSIDPLFNSWKRDIKKFQDKRSKLSTADLNKKKKAEENKIKVRAISLINSGFIRKGISLLESHGVAPINNPSIIDQMRRKHPQNIDTWEAFTPLEPDNFQLDCMLPLIKNLDIHKGTGPRSFKNDYLIKLVTCRKLSDISQRAVNNLIKLGQYYLSGNIPENYRLLLSGGLLTPLIKKESDDHQIEARPVKAEDADTSIFCRALSKSMTTVVNSIVTPQQLAIGVENGIQLYITGINLKLEEADRLNQRLSVVSLDIRNAHNEFNRKSMIAQLNNLIPDHPDLTKLRCGLLSTIGIQPTIYMKDYSKPSGYIELCRSCQGGGQGNALTNIAFPIAINSFIKACETQYPNVEVRAYQDNITLIGSINDIFNGAYQFIIDGIHGIGCRTNPDMFTIFSNEADSNLELVPDHFKRPSINIDNNTYFGVEICGSPIGHPEFRKLHIQRYANDIINTIESTNQKISEVSKHSALIATNLSFQNRFDYICDINLPSETLEARSSIDVSLKHLYNNNLGCKVFDIDNTSPDPSFVADRAQLRLSDGGIGYRPLQDRFNYINMMNRIIPDIPNIIEDDEIIRRGTWPSLVSVTGNTFNELTRWQGFFNNNQLQANELINEWRKIQRIKLSLTENLGEAIRTDYPDLDCDVNLFGKNIKKLSKKISDILNKLRVDALNERASRLHRDDPRRIAYTNVKDDDFATSILCTSNTTFNTSNEIFQEISANHLGLPSPACTNFVGQLLPGAQNEGRLDAFGYKLKSLSNVRGDSTRTLHNMILDLFFKELNTAKIWNRGSAPNTCKDIFIQHIRRNIEDNDERNIQGIIPDIQYNKSQDLNTSSTLGDVKTLSPCLDYINTYGNRKPVDNRADQVQNDYINKAKRLDRTHNGVIAGDQGPVETHLRSFNNGMVDGLVVGPFGECSRQIHALRDLIAERKANYVSHHVDIDNAQILSKFKKSMSKSWGLFFASGWARLLLERLQLFYARARQNPPDLELPPEESNMAFNLLFV